MDNLNTQHLAFQVKFLTLFSHSFQEWVESLLQLIHPTDFQRIRVTQGDGGIDGLVVNEQKVYQCFGPRGFTDGEAAAKMRKDFRTAHDFVEGRLKEWVFVHNDPEDKIGKEMAKTLLDLKAEYPKVQIDAWGFSRLWTEIVKVPVNQRVPALGLSISEESMAEVQFPEIEQVLTFVKDADISSLSGLGSMPDENKLAFNDLSEDAKAHLRLGGRKEKLVERYLVASHRITYGEQLAESFRQQYFKLESTGLPPDLIFANLLDFAGWRSQLDVKHSSAVFAVLCYFFNACDIFRNPSYS